MTLWTTAELGLGVEFANVKPGFYQVCTGNLLHHFPGGDCFNA